MTQDDQTYTNELMALLQRHFPDVESDAAKAVEVTRATLEKWGKSAAIEVDFKGIDPVGWLRSIVDHYLSGHRVAALMQIQETAGVTFATCVAFYMTQIDELRRSLMRYSSEDYRAENKDAGLDVRRVNYAVSYLQGDIVGDLFAAFQSGSARIHESDHDLTAQLRKHLKRHVEKEKSWFEATVKANVRDPDSAVETAAPLLRDCFAAIMAELDAAWAVDAG